MNTTRRRFNYLLLTFVIISVLLLVGCAKKTNSPTTSATTSASSTTTTTTTKTTTSATTASGTPVTVNLVAQSMSFDKQTITVSAGAAVTIIFDNKDTAFHNFALYNNSSANPPAIFQGTTISGSQTTTYNFTAPATPGTYFFRCDVHPFSMTGSFIVTP